ncbi:MAG: hypothetical protein BroJett001_28890 [Chloroflexota bacterium]|nr:MAG: hypothetical protein BroJett001_28890 [Chloroflexota bacterium]
MAWIVELEVMNLVRTIHLTKLTARIPKPQTIALKAFAHIVVMKVIAIAWALTYL